MGASISAAARPLLSAGEFDSQNLAITAWSFATRGIIDEPLLAAIASSAIRPITDYQAQHLMLTAWAYDSLALQHDDRCDVSGMGSERAVPLSVALGNVPGCAGSCFGTTWRA